MVKYFLIICLIASIGNLCYGQQLLPEANQQARSNVESDLYKLADEIKLMDEPTFRLFLRIRLATFLWSRSKNIEAASRAEIIAQDALADLEAHEKEIPSLYAKLFRRDLLALFQLHLPALAAHMVEQDKVEQKNSRNEFEIAYSMLDSKNGTRPAVDMVRRNLSSGQDPKNMLIYFLGQLEQQNSPELQRLLTEIVAIEEKKAGTVPVNTLLQIIKFYLKDETPTELRGRYFAVIVRTVELNYKGFDQNLMHFSYQVLNNVVLPGIRSLIPSLYPHAQSVTATLAGRIPQSALDQIAIRNRINQSADPLNQLIVEANATKDESLKESLLIEAAQLAMGKGQLKLALDLLPESSNDPNYRLWRDQFLGDLVNTALKTKDTEMAGYAASKINSPLRRASALEKIALDYFEAKKLAYARELLNDAVKAIEKSEGDAEKAKEYLNITLAFMKIDEVRVTEMIQAAIKSINNIPQPKIEEKADSAARQAYAKTLTEIGWNIVPVFRSFAQKDEIGTFLLASGIQRREAKAFAIFGAYIGLISASESSASKSRN